MSDESVYGIFVRNIVAKGSTNNSRDAKGLGDFGGIATESPSLTLIDKRGCPEEGRLMREVRTLDESSKSLESVFEAFSFTGSNQLELQAEVETCLDRCRPVHCQVRSSGGTYISPQSARSEDEEYESVTSYGRRRRRRRRFADVSDAIEGDVLRIETIARKITITQDDKNKSGNFNHSLPEISSSDEESNLIPTSLFLTGSHGNLSVSSSSTQTTPSDGNRTTIKATSRRTPPIKVQRTQQILSRGKNPSSPPPPAPSLPSSEEYDVQESGQLCFDPLSIMTIVVFCIFLQMVLFSITFAFLSRRYRRIYGISSSASTVSLFPSSSLHQQSLHHLPYHHSQHLNLHQNQSRLQQESFMIHSNRHSAQALPNFNPHQHLNQHHSSSSPLPSPSSINLMTTSSPGNSTQHLSRQYYHHRSNLTSGQHDNI